MNVFIVRNLFLLLIGFVLIAIKMSTTISAASRTEIFKFKLAYGVAVNVPEEIRLAKREAKRDKTIVKVR